MLAQAVEAGKIVAEQLGRAQDKEQVLILFVAFLVVALVALVVFHVRTTTKWVERETKLTDAAVERERELGKDHAGKVDSLHVAHLKSSEDYNLRLERLLRDGLENGE